MNPHLSNLVSIIVPCYKAERELPDALKSIASQTHSRWELIAVNDAWDDNTPEIISDFAKAHPHHRVIFEKHPYNKGLGATRNTGMALSQGDFIAFLDHDDIWEPKHLERGLCELIGKKAQICFSSVSIFQTDTKIKTAIWGPTPEDLAVFPQTLFERNFITPSSVIIAKTLLDILGPMSPLRCCEDHDYWLRAVTLGGKFVTTNEITVNYRGNSQEKLSSNCEVMLKQDIEVQKNHLHAKPFSTSIKRKAIANNYFLLFQHSWSKGHFSGWIYLFLSIFWYPFQLNKILKYFYSSSRSKSTVQSVLQQEETPR